LKIWTIASRLVCENERAGVQLSLEGVQLTLASVQLTLASVQLTLADVQLSLELNLASVQTNLAPVQITLASVQITLASDHLNPLLSDLSFAALQFPLAPVKYVKRGVWSVLNIFIIIIVKFSHYSYHNS
jgi:hypothetical protein